MEHGVIQHTTRTLGKSQGYLGLNIRDVLLENEDGTLGTQAMQSAWFPTPKELEALLNGAPIILTVLGTAHPPVKLDVGLAPQEHA